MARLPLQGSKMNKIKFGTTVEVATPDRIKELRSKNPESIRSTGEAIDYLSVLFTGLTPRVAEAMGKACQKELQLTAQEMRHLSYDGSEELSIAELERDYNQLLRLHEHFSLYYMDVAENKPRDMRRIELADNDFAVVPSSWILICDGKAQNLSARFQLLKSAEAQNTVRLTSPSSITASITRRMSSTLRFRNGLPYLTSPMTHALEGGIANRLNHVPITAYLSYASTSFKTRPSMRAGD